MPIFYLAQLPPLPPPQDFKPPVVAPQFPNPLTPANPLTPIPDSRIPTRGTPTILTTELLTVTEFTFTGNTVFTAAELAQKITAGLEIGRAHV